MRLHLREIFALTCLALIGTAPRPLTAANCAGLAKLTLKDTTIKTAENIPAGPLKTPEGP